MRRILWLGLAGLAFAIGCSEDGGPESLPVADGREETPVGASTIDTVPAVKSLNQPFDLAASPIAPLDSVPPPTTTLAGKPTVTLLTAVKDTWNEVRFTTTEGKADPVRVVLATDAGEVEITLFPDLAPNHVRNFLALAKVGYYDGLVFERVVKREAVTTAGESFRFELVTAGCPGGTGSPGQGHLGYFLKPEFNAMTHEEGTVGFWREDDDVSACTRFYVTLSPCQVMDGKYTVVGKVTRGMEAVYRIAGGRLSELDLERPVSPVAIQKAHVQ